MIENVEEVGYQKYQNEPVLEKTKMEIIKALSHHQLGAGPSCSIDFISGKGEGVVLLFHG
jgi:hypothetical protein